jgi:hypothetical protein
VDTHGRRLYVYYRVGAADLEAAVAAVQGLHAAVSARHPGLHAELLRRAGTGDGHVTLMETYAAPGGIDTGLQAAIEAAARQHLGALVDGARHVEVFVPCA